MQLHEICLPLSSQESSKPTSRLGEQSSNNRCRHAFAACCDVSDIMPAHDGASLRACTSAPDLIYRLQEEEIIFHNFLSVS